MSGKPLMPSLMILAAGACWGTLLIWGKFFSDKGFSLFEVAFYYMAFISLMLLPFVIFKKGMMLKKELWKFYLQFGIIGASLQIFQFGGVVLGVPVALAAMLLYSQPVWSVIFGKLLLKESITKAKIAAVVLAIIGVAVLLNPFSEAAPLNVFGALAALMGGVSLSLWNIWSRKSQVENQPQITTLFSFVFFSSLILILLYPLLSYLMPDQLLTGVKLGNVSEFWPFIILFAINSGPIASLLYYRGIGKVEASSAGVLLLTEPLTAALLALLFFSQPLTANIILGGAFILLSNYVIIRWGQ